VTINLILRPAQARDVEPIAIMSRELIESGWGWRYRPDNIRRLIRDPDMVVLVATNHERVLAFAVMEFGDERAHLVLLVVHPAHERQGTGRRMIGWLLESAATAGIASMHLELRAGNAVAHAFYRAGFRRYSTHSRLLPGPRIRDPHDARAAPPITQ